MGGLKYLVLATPRSGTTFITKAFNSIDINCGHERIFGPEEGIYELTEIIVQKRMMKFIDTVVDSSWYAVPFLNLETSVIPELATIIHLVRHPLAVIESLLAIRLFQRETSDFSMMYAIKHTPNIESNDSEIIKCCKFYLHWNRQIELSNKVAWRHRVEDDIKLLFNVLGLNYHEKNVFNNKQANTRNKKDRILIGIQDISSQELLFQLKEIAVNYGYDLASREITPSFPIFVGNRQISAFQNNFEPKQLRKNIFTQSQILEWYRWKLQISMNELLKYK